MRKTNIFLFSFLLFINTAFTESIDLAKLYNQQKIVRSVKQIHVKEFPGAFNPSIIKFGSGFLLSFRYSPDVCYEPWISYIGLVILDSHFNPVSEPQLLTTRFFNPKTPSQSEDARIFIYKGRYFLTYNDNLEITSPSTWDRRDMFISEVFYEHGKFSSSIPIKLFCKEKYDAQRWQKNWIPFEVNNHIFFIYSINPHEILYPNLISGECYSYYSSWKELQWNWGHLKGSTSPELVGDQFLSFFHSGFKGSSSASNGWNLWHYFFGAYTFSSTPPYEMKKISSTPIVAEEFYTQSEREKRVIYPGGFVVQDPYIYLAYGKDDCEIWIATLNKEELLHSLVSVREE